MRMHPHHFLPLLCLAAAVAARGAEPAWLPEALQQAHSVIRMWSHEAQGVAEEFQRHDLQAPDTAPTSDAMPEAPEGETVVVCDGALLFDTDGNNVVYVDNVRLNDSRLQLRAHNRLFIRLAGNAVQAKTEDVRESAGDNLSEASLDPSADGAQRSKLTLPAGLETVQVETDDAVVDTENNHIILYSPAGGKAITIRSGENTVNVGAAADKPATVLVDAAGNMLLEGAALMVKWKDREGRLAELHGSGMAYFNLEQSGVVLQGPCSLTHPAVRVSSQTRLCASLQLEKSDTHGVGFMEQFGGLRCHGVTAVQADGPVTAEMTAEDGTAASLSGDTLRYDAASGLCELEGSDCALKYGANSLRGAQSLRQLPDGSLRVSGAALSGTYERPAAEAGQPPLRGTFLTGGELTFTEGGDGTATVLLPQGIRAKDAEADFSCTGAVRLVLLADEKVKLPELNNSKVNLALLRYRTPGQVQAEGTVRAHRYAGDTPTAELQAESVFADWQAGTATLRGTAELPVVALFEGNRLVAAGGAPYAELNRAGDIALRGDTIDAEFTTKEGKAKAHCLGGLDLKRADNTLETLSAAEIDAPQGHLKTNGPVRALLAVDPKADETRGGVAPQLSFPYTGIRELRTERGGMVQSPKGSLRCSGPVRVVMADTPGAEFGGLQQAEAHGNVVLAAKDSNNKLYTASGDSLSYDAESGEKVLTGGTVTLADEFNTHTMSGGNAAVRVDKRNHVRISGATMKTEVNHIRQQVEQQQQKQKK